MKTENLHLDRNMRKGLLYKISSIVFFFLTVRHEIIFLFHSLNNDTKAGLHGPLNTEGEDVVKTLILCDCSGLNHDNDEPNFLHQMPKKMYLSVYYKYLLVFIQV